MGFPKGVEHSLWSRPGRYPGREVLFYSQPAETAVVARDSRESQREAVLCLMMPLLTAWPRALLTSRICIWAFSELLASIESRAFFIRVRSFDLASMFRVRRVRLC